jgi:hypothetical protein
MTDRIRWRGVRIENAGNGIALRSCGAQPCGEEYAREKKGNPRNPADDRWPIQRLHCLDDPNQASPLRTSVKERLVTAIAVEDPDCLHTPTMQRSLQAIVRGRAKQQTALIERLTDDKDK